MNKQVIYLLTICLLLSSCKLVISSGENGKVYKGSDNGSWCYPTCSIDTAVVVDESYHAIADLGYKFDHWDGPKGFCKDEASRICEVKQFGPLDIAPLDNYEMDLEAVFSIVGTASEDAVDLKASNANIGDQFGIATSLSADGQVLAIAAMGEASSATGINSGSIAENDNSSPSAGAVYVFVQKNGSWVQQAYIKASNTDTGDFFGAAVSLNEDGSTLAVGAPYEDGSSVIINPQNSGGYNSQADNLSREAGAVYVFRRSGDTWTQDAYLKPENNLQGKHFGTSVSIDANGNILAVGAPDDRTLARGINPTPHTDYTTPGTKGAAYVFERSNDTWSQQLFYKGGGEQRPNSDVGSSVSLSANGNTLVISDPDAGGVGAIHILQRRDNNPWFNQVASGSYSAVGAGELFGLSIKLSADGSTLAVAAPGEDSDGLFTPSARLWSSNDNLRDSGAVYIMTLVNSRWEWQASIKASDARIDERFGTVDLSADGNTLIVGVARSDSNVDPQARSLMYDSGTAYLYKREGTSWLQHRIIKAKNAQAGDGFGWAVSIDASGSSFAISAKGGGSGSTFFY